MKFGAVAARIVIVVLIALGLGEVLARVFLTSPSVQVFDPALGYANVPNGRTFQSREGFQRLTLNALGLNDREVGPKLPGGTRALFVGDSTTFAAQVPREQNFTSRLEASTPGLDAIDAGRDALGPQQWNAVLDRLQAATSPDVVVFVMSRGDAFDLQGSHAVVAHDAAGAPTAIAYKSEREDGLQKLLGPLLRRSALATYLARRGESVVTDTTTGTSWIAKVMRLKQHKGGGAVKRNSAEDQLDTAAITPQLADVMRLVKARTRVAFVYIPSFVYGPSGSMEFEHRSLLERPAMHEAAREAGVTLIDLSPDFQAAYKATGRPLTGFNDSKLGEGHLNSYGHSVVAAALKARLVPVIDAEMKGAH